MPKSRSQKETEGALTGFGTIGPDWMKRALDPSTPTTAARETVRTTSFGFGDKEILVPTVRMRENGLEKLTPQAAFDEAVQRNDFLSFNTPKEATAFSKELSAEIGRRRKKK